MNYIALARAWRPKTFSELSGQNAIKKALENALNKNRLHHAYLFTGTRGVGKTSIARLFAKSINCEQGISSTPCLLCDTCKDIEAGSYIDLIEIDGASKTRVEDTRELLENIHYAPVRGRYKIYLIDEVHMLSQHSFNALLKTLEEPPSHVKFLLATTDPQKLPLTVLSRCLNFHLKPLTDTVIIEHLEKILQSENITHDSNALALLAKAAKGSMRDALSLLDQVLALVDTHINLDDARAFLGYTSTDYALEILYALATLEPKRLLDLSNHLTEEGANPIYVLEEIIGYLHKITIQQILNNTNDTTKNNKFVRTDDINESINNLSIVFNRQEVQLLYEIATKGLESIHIAPTRRIGFEMILLRMVAFRPMLGNEVLHFNNDKVEIHDPAPKTVGSAVDRNLPSNHQPQEVTANVQVSTTTNDTANNSSNNSSNKNSNDTVNFKANIKEENLPNINRSKLNKEDTTDIEINDTNKGNAGVANSDISQGSWRSIISQLNLSGLAHNAIINTQFVSMENNVITIKIHANHSASFTPIITKRIEDGLTQYFKNKISLKINEYGNKILPNSQEKSQSLISDPFFQQLQEEFSGALIKNSVTLTDEDDL